MERVENLGLEAGILEGKTQERRAWKTHANVLARLPGRIAPRQWIIVGAAGSGPARNALFRLAGGLAHLQRAGWRPARTVVLAWWDGEGGAAAWAADQLPLVEPVASLRLDPAGGSAASPALRPLLRAVLEELEMATGAVKGPAGEPLDAPFLAAAVPTATFATDVTGLRAAARVALRLAEARLPLLSTSARTVHLIDALNDLSPKIHAAFEGNPPPLGPLRSALAAYRTAAEQWDLDRRRWMHQGRLSAQQRARLPEIEVALDRARRAHLPPSERRCGNLVICTSGDQGPGYLVPMARQVRDADRDALVAEILVTAESLRAATVHLEEAHRLLQTR